MDRKEATERLQEYQTMMLQRARAASWMRGYLLGEILNHGNVEVRRFASHALGVWARFHPIMEAPEIAEQQHESLASAQHQGLEVVPERKP
ncbi:MAG: hypothetical protein ACREIS_08175 [Nitrospiraceae bacterium]